MPQQRSPSPPFSSPISSPNAAPAFNGAAFNNALNNPYAALVSNPLSFYNYPYVNPFAGAALANRYPNGLLNPTSFYNYPVINPLSYPGLNPLFMPSNPAFSVSPLSNPFNNPSITNPLFGIQP
jgi:hypothetical protein